MSGICGFISRENLFSKEALVDLVTRMGSPLHHRGPDGDGNWVDAAAGVALGHLRLAAPVGQTPQPLVSPSGRYVITFDGAVHNGRALLQAIGEETAKTLARHSYSDASLVLAAIERWGMEEVLRRASGAFAFAMWDREARTLYLARDRLGEKPIYYGEIGKNFAFGSELKALHACPSWEGVVDRNALALYLRYRYVPAPYSIYRGIYKLPPGCYLAMRWCGGRPLTSTPLAFWSPLQTAEDGASNPVTGDQETIAAQLETVLGDAVRPYADMNAPVGAFLSGGIDSSTIVALTQAQSARPVRTFCAGFHEQGYDETAHAKAIAQHLGTEHTEIHVGPAQALACVPQLAMLYDEPVGDPAAIPILLLSQLAREHVGIVLTGTGGDETLGGAGHYFSLAERYWRALGWMPAGMRKLLANGVDFISPSRSSDVLSRLTAYLPGSVRREISSHRLCKLAEVMVGDSPESMYLSLISHWNRPVAIVRDGIEPRAAAQAKQWTNGMDVRRRLIYFDMVNILPDDLLVTVDRSSMGASLEARSPMLDPRVVEFAWKLPLEMKLRDGQNKWLLRQVLARYVPPALIERPKSGLGVPLESWLRGPLRDWAESLLDEDRLRREGFFDPAPIRQTWKEHLRCAQDLQYHLWDILMFQAWQDAFAAS